MNMNKQVQMQISNIIYLKHNKKRWYSVPSHSMKCVNREQRLLVSHRCRHTVKVSHGKIKLCNIWVEHGNQKVDFSLRIYTAMPNEDL